MRRFLLPLLAVALLLAACGDDGSTQDDGETFDPPSSTAGSDPDDDLPEDVVVFTPDDVETDVNGEEVTWTPTTEDIEGVERVLTAHIGNNADLGVDDLDEYHRQYVGTGQEGEDVSVNALCDVDDLDWEDDLILVNDGGPCFWQATFSFLTLELTAFSVNGSA